MYKVRLGLNLDKICSKYPHNDKKAIYEAIKDLGTNPRPMGSKKLSGRDGYRIRVGNYRIIYQIKDEELLVLVIDLDNRSNIYRKF